MRKSYARKPKRPEEMVKRDVESSSKVVREDIYDLIKDTKSKTEAEQKVSRFFEGVNLGSRYHKNQAISRIVSDLPSYGIKWEE